MSVTRGKFGIRASRSKSAGIETGGMRDLVRRRHNDLRHRRETASLQQCRPQRMLVDSVKTISSTLVCPKRRHQKARLQQQAPRAAIELGGRLEVFDDEAFKRVRRPPVTAKLVVERQESTDETGAQIERR